MTSVVVTGAPPRSDRLRHWVGLGRLLAVKNFRQRFLRSRLGIAWAIVQPSVQAVVLSVVFLRIFKMGRVPHYPVYLLSGIMCWQFFQQGTLQGTTSVVDNGGLVRKVAMPKVLFPFAAVGSSLIVFGLQICVVLAVAATQGTLGRQVPLLLVLAPLEFALASGFAVLGASLHVAIRDVRFVIESGLMLGFYVSPILWDPSQLSPHLQHLARLNPMTGLLSLVRGATMSRPVDWAAVGVTLGFAVVVWAVAAPLFARRSRVFADTV